MIRCTCDYDVRPGSPTRRLVDPMCVCHMEPEPTQPDAARIVYCACGAEMAAGSVSEQRGSCYECRTGIRNVGREQPDAAAGARALVDMFNGPAGTLAAELVAARGACDEARIERDEERAGAEAWLVRCRAALAERDAALSQLAAKTAEVEGLRAALGRLQIVAEGFAGTAESAVRNFEDRNKGGQHVAFFGDFAHVNPSTIGRLRWWAREFRAALATPAAPGTDSRATGTEVPAKGGGGRLLNRDPSPARDAPVRTADAERADVCAWLRERLCDYTAVLVEEGKHIGAAARRAGEGSK